jgi:hypothetical protein
VAEAAADLVEDVVTQRSTKRGLLYYLRQHEPSAVQETCYFISSARKCQGKRAFNYRAWVSGAEELISVPRRLNT